MNIIHQLTNFFKNKIINNEHNHQLLKTKIEIEKWLNKYQIKNYELIEDKEYGYVVNVNNKVDLSHKKLKSIDVKFNIVRGYFDCSNNELKSLEGCPNIVKDEFYCHDNNLITLKDCPTIVGSDFFCNDNKLESLNNLISLIKVEIKSNYIGLNNNKNLGELENKTNFDEIKKILNIYKEKKELDLLLKNNYNMINQIKIDKL